MNTVPSATNATAPSVQSTNQGVLPAPSQTEQKVSSIAQKVDNLKKKSSRAIRELKHNPRKRNICLAVTGLCVAVGAVATRYLVKCQCIHPSALWNHDFTPLYNSAVQFGSHYWEMAKNITFYNR